MSMNSIKRFKNLMSILILYASSLIVHDKAVISAEYFFPTAKPRLTGPVFPKLTTNEK